MLSVQTSLFRMGALSVGERQILAANRVACTLIQAVFDTHHFRSIRAIDDTITPDLQRNYEPCKINKSNQTNVLGGNFRLHSDFYPLCLGSLHSSFF